MITAGHAEDADDAGGSESSGRVTVLMEKPEYKLHKPSAPQSKRNGRTSSRGDRQSIIRIAQA